MTEPVANQSRAAAAETSPSQLRMNVVIPMAGAGSRFVQAGYERPKPLIDVAGKPMYRWAVDSLPLQQAERLVFILRRDQYTDELIADIEQHYRDWQPRISLLEHLSGGQAETVYLARSQYDLQLPILIHNADTAFALPQGMTVGDAFGALVVFDDDAPRWSFARTDASGQVVEVREKVVISRHASTGTYYFADTGWLMQTIEQAITHNQREQGEFYIAPLYNLALEQGKSVVLQPCSQFTCMGTPLDLAAALPQIPALQQAQAAVAAKMAP